MQNSVKLNTGKYQAAIDNAIKYAQKDNLVARVWQRDHSVWAESADEISNRLAWLDIAERMQTEVTKLAYFADSVNKHGIGKVLLLGMGGSSLAPEVLSNVFGAAEGHPSLSVLDSTDPRAVREKMDAHDPSQTLYIVATKSGGTVETISFFKTFYNQAAAKLGKNEAGQHFVAITDPGSKLAKLAEEHAFRRTFLNDPNIGGRFSALSYFGLVPAALLGVDLKKWLERAVTMAEACRHEEAGKNPGALLGLAMGALAEEGRDKLTFIMPDEISSFGDWAEQLIAESTGKAGKGILPVVGNDWGHASAFGEDRLVAEIGSSGGDGDESGETPSVSVVWHDDYDIGAQFFLWEFATAVAGHVMGIQPFNQPNVEAAKVLAREMVAAFEEEGRLPELKRVGLNADAVNELLAKAKPGAYVAIQAYAPASATALEVLRELKATIEHKSKLACTVGFGPRFLHSTGQLHKGNAGKGLFLQILDDGSAEDLPIPDEVGVEDSTMSYEVLKQAQAAGDAGALIEGGREVLQAKVDGEFAAEIQNLIAEIA